MMRLFFGFKCKCFTALIQKTPIINLAGKNAYQLYVIKACGHCYIATKRTQNMPFYELMFIARQDLAPGQVEELTKQYETVITENGGKIHKTDHWGLRTMAYRISKNRKGHYVLMELDTPPAALHELERQMRLSEDVLRYMAIRIDALSDLSDAEPKTEKEAA